MAYPVSPDSAFLRSEENGWLLLSIGSNLGAGKLLVGAARLDIPASGDQYFLYELKPGRYEWKEFRSPRGKYYQMYWRLRGAVDSERRRFTIEPGVINYAGFLGLNRVSWNWTEIQLVNRSSMAIEHLRENHPELLDRYSFRYGGFQRDDFPEAYLEALRAQANADGVEGASTP